MGQTMGQTMPVPNPIRVVIADDHRLIREGVKAGLSEADNIIVVGEADNGKTALELVADLEPDVLLADIEMPIMTGVEVAKELKRSNSPVYVLALSAFADRAYVYGMLDSGASGYIMKAEANSETLTDAIESIVETKGEFWISPAFAGKLIKQHLNKRKSQTTLNTLTDREQEILQVVAAGKSNMEAGEVLFITAHTVKNHIEHIKSKIGIRSRAELIAWAWRNDFVAGEQA